MKLFSKTLVIIAVIMLVLVVVLNTAMYDTVGDEFKNTEERVISKDTDRVDSLIQREGTQQMNQITDLANWTLLYDYVQNPEGSFLTGLYVNDTLYSMNTNFILIFDRNGTLIDGEALNFITHDIEPVPKALVDFVNSTPEILTFSLEMEKHQLFANVGDEVALIATSPILTTEGMGPMVGSALLGRYLDDREIDLVAKLGNVNLTAEKALDQNLPGDFADAVSDPSFNSTGRYYAVLGSDSIAMYTSLRAPDGELLMVLKVSDDRALYRQGMAGFQYANIFLVISLAASGTGLLILLMYNVLRPVSRLNKEMLRIGDSGDLSARVPGSQQDDEIAQLTGSLNDMLVQLESKDKGLKDSERRYRELVESSIDWIWRTDREGRLQFSNAIVSSHLDFSPEELSQMTFRDLIDEDDARANEFNLRISGDLIDPIREAVKIHTRGGKAFLFEMNAQPIFDENGIWQGYHGVARDITDRVRNEKELEKTNRQLNLLSSITRHDILNQTTVLYGYSELLWQENTDLVSRQYLEKQQQVIETIAKQIKLSGIYQQLGTQEPVWNDTKQLLNSVTRQFDLHNLQVRIDVRTVEVLADPIMEKVFYNLIENVLRHSGASELNVFDRDRDGDLIIVIQDNGKGIPSELKDRIFDRGFGQNTGLGLFLTREILATTGIEIVENGQPGSGARFEITVHRGQWRIAPVS